LKRKREEEAALVDLDLKLKRWIQT